MGALVLHRPLHSVVTCSCFPAVFLRTVYLLAHNVTLISRILLLQLKLINKYQVSFFHEGYYCF